MGSLQPWIALSIAYLLIVQHCAGQSCPPDVELVSSGRPAVQQTIPDPTRAADVAVDNDQNTCFVQDQAPDTWWVVDLGSTRNIRCISFLDHTHTGAGNPGTLRLTFGVISTYPDVGDPLPAMYDICDIYRGPSGQGAAIDIPCSTTDIEGQYVAIKQVSPAQDVFSLCEVEVYVTPHPVETTTQEAAETSTVSSTVEIDNVTIPVTTTSRRYPPGTRIVTRDDVEKALSSFMAVIGVVVFLLIVVTCVILFCSMKKKDKVSPEEEEDDYIFSDEDARYFLTDPFLNPGGAVGVPPVQTFMITRVKKPPPRPKPAPRLQPQTIIEEDLDQPAVEENAATQTSAFYPYDTASQQEPESVSQVGSDSYSSYDVSMSDDISLYSAGRSIDRVPLTKSRLSRYNKSYQQQPPQPQKHQQQKQSQAQAGKDNKSYSRYVDPRQVRTSISSSIVDVGPKITSSFEDKSLGSTNFSKEPQPTTDVGPRTSTRESMRQTPERYRYGPNDYLV